MVAVFGDIATGKEEDEAVGEHGEQKLLDCFVLEFVLPTTGFEGQSRVGSTYSGKIKRSKDDTEQTIEVP